MDMLSNRCESLDVAASHENRVVARECIDVIIVFSTYHDST